MKIPSILTTVTLILWAVALRPLCLEAAAVPPARVTIDQLRSSFAAVDFDHAAHVDMGTDCADCHHHTTGTKVKKPECLKCHDSAVAGTTVACRDCHPAQPYTAEFLRKKAEDRNRYHLDKPGLKGAYHRNCVGCHQEMGGPTGCLACHPRTEAGDKLYRTGKFSPAPRHNATGH